MEYARTNDAGTIATQLGHDPIEWDANNYCSADALTKDGKSDQFNVVPLTAVGPPQFDALTHKCFRDGCELVDGQWQYKWSVVELTEQELAANAAASAAQAREAAKAARAAAVDAIVVTTTAGNAFDGDETSQTRMARAIIALQATGTPTVNWILHDNSVIQATVAELSEALALAGAAQAAIWVI